ncbi:MAG: UDP-3-O-(3-hydroxymyristoyl)glucosamine N-acyltransferase [Flavobacteriaceae bacterium]|nr:UDP-3-O-(3-hydroxymyristoyl)glucosamine N-acyltransferase [Flavobacteriaceae bacterium]
MKFTARQIATILEGEVEGNPDVEVQTVSKIEEGEKGSLTFLSNQKYTPYIYKTNASITIVNDSFVPEIELRTTLIRVPDAYAAFSKLLSYYDSIKKTKSGIESPSYINEAATYGNNLYLGAFSYVGAHTKIGDNVTIHPNVYIAENVTIGNEVTIFPGARICSDTVIGNYCVIHPNAVIGSDGFGFAPQEDGSYSKIPQIGHVIIEDHVDVGAGTTIDRATIGVTVIREGVKLDNQIQIAHNVEVGAHTVIAAQTGIAGSTKIGKHCMIGGQVGIVGHITIGDYVKVQAQSGVGRNVKSKEILQGSPAFGYQDFNKSYVHFKNLPKTIHKLDTKDYL